MIIGKELFKYQNKVNVIGLTQELDVFYVLNYFKENNDNVLIVTSSIYDANSFYEKLLTYSENVLFFPMDDFITSVAVAMSPEFKIKRLEALEKIKTNDKFIVVTNLMGFLRFLPDKNKADKLHINLKRSSSINREKLISIFEEFGYNRDSLVSATGEYAVRGFVIDIFLVNEVHPIRIEFFGNEIDSIRYFDENSQMSIGEVEEIDCLPYKEIKTSLNSNIRDYLNDPMLFLYNQSNIKFEYDKIIKEELEYKEENKITTDLMFKYDLSAFDKYICLNDFDEADGGIRYSSKQIDNFNSNTKLLQDFVENRLKNNKTIFFCLSSNKEINNMMMIFPQAIEVKINEYHENKINIINYKINNGYEFDKYVVISEYDIENIKNHEVKYRNTYKIGKKIKDFSQLEIGDYVVHTMHGIGVYNGVITLEKNGIKKDYLLINYAGNDKVYVPVEKISSIFKYSSKDGVMPKINHLDSASWNNTKKSLKSRIKDISQELLKLYTARASMKGVPFKDDPMEVMFGSEFKYEPTPDQDRAFIDINKDLDSVIPMDRLLCGDVGFGKTEVAFRAMFKTIVNGAQVLYLCPTTILSNQQYENAKERFSEFPVEIGLLNRFTTKKETERIVEGLKAGKIDIVFGTHRLLSGDIKCKNLGLLVVDEEQRFGVTHKEKIKELKNDVNVLTLSATPIPRTLKMALTGLRDLSIIDTPPVNRYPVQTYVLQENDLLIKDAIYKELARHGQVFILYNKVASIDSKKAEISRLVPEARIVVAHGQMNKTQLEEVMANFIDYKYDILLCTTIIETGIDIPNANTLMIFDADCFGLSQLYQIRGRVGRSNKVAYAYLMYNKAKMLNDIAIKRLQAIKEFTELGSGYRIAMRDLSLRGAGDILGSEQAGFVDAVGLDLYMKMLDDQIKELKGEAVLEEEQDNKALIDVDTHIDDAYVSDEDLKIEIHQKINEIDSNQKLIEIKNELEDRFGKLDEKIIIYMYEEWFEKLAKVLNINKVVQNDKYVQIVLNNDLVSKIKFDKLFIKAYSICNKFQFKTMGNNVLISLMINGLDKHFIYYLVSLLQLINDEIN